MRRVAVAVAVMARSARRARHSFRGGSQVSLDFYLQGFCVSSLALRQSAFYGAAMHRTAVLRPHLQWHNVSLARMGGARRRGMRAVDARVNGTAGPGARRGRAMCALPMRSALHVPVRTAAQPEPPISMPWDFCQQRACRLRACNNVQ